MIFSNLPKFYPTVLPVMANGTAATITVGNQILIASPTTTIYGAQISTSLADATTGGGDINTPGAWTNFLSLTGRYKILMQNNIGSPSPNISVQVASTEDTGDAIRFQVLRDNTVICDGKVVCNGVTSYVNMTPDENGLIGYATPGLIFDCKSSFLLRATRKGTFVSPNSWFAYSTIAYVTY